MGIITRSSRTSPRFTAGAAFAERVENSNQPTINERMYREYSSCRVQATLLLGPPFWERAGSGSEEPAEAHAAGADLQVGKVKAFHDREVDRGAEKNHIGAVFRKTGELFSLGEGQRPESFGQRVGIGLGEADGLQS